MLNHTLLSMTDSMCNNFLNFQNIILYFKNIPFTKCLHLTQEACIVCCMTRAGFVPYDARRICFKWRKKKLGPMTQEGFVPYDAGWICFKWRKKKLGPMTQEGFIPYDSRRIHAKWCKKNLRHLTQEGFGPYDTRRSWALWRKKNFWAISRKKDLRHLTQSPESQVNFYAQSL
jgi:hypothetical protein